MPTLCELLHIPSPKNIDDISILPEILGKKQTQQHSYLYWEYPEYGGQVAVRIDNWKGLILNINKENMQWQLFDLDKDIQEQHDVAAQHTDIIKQMDAIVRKEHHTPEVSTFLMPALEKQYGNKEN